MVDKALIFSGYGVNSEMESAVALQRAGMASDVVHVNDVIAKRVKLNDYRMLVLPGGFSYGDDTGSGNAYAWRLRNNVWDELLEFLDGDNLVLGICNGFQILVNLGLLPAFGKKRERTAALMPNQSGVFQCRPVTLKPASESFWTRGIERVDCPVAHGEGNFYCSAGDLKRLEEKKLVAFRYVKPDLTLANREFPFNPNGALSDIAGILSEDRKVLGLMPHPERAMESIQLRDGFLQKELARRAGKRLSMESHNLQLFRNAVNYFK
ncbi:phosphoribosylformylglycinamidine synthase subunit PurQ [Candidatus Micrarchaeota archaeon]|nr:phosphoribosylformylglycinamidine synthase subunit PurQ [Candidatus Micrarchaeota archaeon]